MRSISLATVSSALCVACYSGLDPAHGTASDGGEPPTATAGDDAGEPPQRQEPEVTPPDFVDRIGEAGVRRLTAAEYDHTLRDLLGDDASSSALLLPEDARSPYDNEYTLQVASQALIEGAELLAADAAGRLRADPARLAEVRGCEPENSTDAACFESFLRAFGRRALRRPVSEDDLAALMDLLAIAEDSGDFDDAVVAAVRTLLQHPRFLYRVELGEPVPGAPGVFELDDWELATRLSYFLWGTTPDDWLLDAAADGGLGESDGVEAIAAAMLEDPRAQQRIARFHALWIGYEALPFGGEIADAMQQETEALLVRTLFDEDRPWQDLFRATETFASPVLAEHYGLPEPESGWADYGDSGRQGLLSHGTFLSVGAAFDDTSPTQRGIFVRTRLFCEDIPPPPPDVNADEPPAGLDDAVCKKDRYAVHSRGGCATCHNAIDPVGFGLENYGPMGRFRDTEPGLPQCEITGDGEVQGVGTFNGPAELSELLLDQPGLGACVVTQLYRFSVGRYALEDYDEAFVQRLLDELGTGDFRFGELVAAFAGAPAFRYRREEA